MVLEDEKVSKNRKLRRLEIRSLPAFGGARGDQGSEAQRHTNLLTFPPTHLLALYLLTFLFFKIFLFISVYRSFLYPISSFLISGILILLS
jgi:hypothetical protein